jgi:hypothetical protein
MVGSLNLNKLSYKKIWIMQLEFVFNVYFINDTFLLLQQAMYIHLS